MTSTDPKALEKPTTARNRQRSERLQSRGSVAQRSIADLADSEADALGRLAGRDAFRAALEAGVGVAVMRDDEILIVSNSATDPEHRFD